IDGQPVVIATASFADNLFHSLTDHAAGTETQAPTKTATALPGNTAVAHSVTAPPEKPAAAQSANPSGQSPALDDHSTTLQSSKIPSGQSPALDDHSTTLQPSNSLAPAPQKSPDIGALLLSFFD